MILVTGGTGFIGHTVVRRLCDGGEVVRVLGRSAPAIPMPAGAEWVACDLATGVGLSEALCGVRVVVHLAGVLDGGGDAAQIVRVNVDGTRMLAEAAAARGIEQFIHVSSAGVYGCSRSPVPRGEDDLPAPGTPYERSKLRGEEVLRGALRGTNVRWTILRPTGIFGARRQATAALFEEVARRRVWVHCPPVTVHPLYVDDFAEAIARTVGADRLHGQVVNLGGDRPLDYRELLSLIGTHVGRRPVHLAPPAWMDALARAAVRRSGSGDQRRSLIPGLAWPAANRSVRIDRARALLDFTPTPIERAVELTARAIAARP